MRGRWALAAGVVLALVVVGGIGGLTVRAFAGTTHTVMHTKTVTKLCVYVDRTHGGDSYGDVSVIPKYNHKVCIAGKDGKRGPAGADGDTSVITWNKTVAEPTQLPLAPRNAGLGGPPPTAVDLVTVGPFTVKGVCEAGEGVEAATYVSSSQDGSFLTWNNNFYNGTFNSGNTIFVSGWATGGPQSPAWVNDGPRGDFSVSTADNTTAFTAFANEGVYMAGANGPACSFTGYLVVENPSS